MKSILRLVSLLILLSGWSLAALSLYGVRTPDGFALVPKNDLGVWDTYADTRNWTLDDVTKHAALAQRIVQSGHAVLLGHIVPGATGGDLERKLNEAIARAPQTQRPGVDLSRSAVAAADAARRIASTAWTDLNNDSGR